MDKKQQSIWKIASVLFGFFVMGFCDIVDISLDLKFQSLQAKCVQHPSLFYIPQRIEQARLRMKTDSDLRNAWKEIQKKADNFVRKPILEKSDCASLAYSMTGEKKYSDALKNVLLKTVDEQKWTVEEMMERKPAWCSELGISRKALAAALAYDAVYNELSASERNVIACSLYRLAVQPLLGDWILDSERIMPLIQWDIIGGLLVLYGRNISYVPAKRTA